MINSGSLKRFWKKHGATILSIAGSISVIGVAISSSNDTIKASKIIRKKEDTKNKKKLIAAAKCYTPTIMLSLSAITFISGSNYYNKKIQLSMAGAYVLLRKSYNEYRRKISNEIGEEIDKKIFSEIVTDKYKKNPINPSPKKELFYEENYGEYFESTMEDVLKAEYYANRKLANDGVVSVEEFLAYLKLDANEDTSYIGWIANETMIEWQGYPWIDFNHDWVEIDEGLNCCIISYGMAPSDIDEGYL